MWSVPLPLSTKCCTQFLACSITASSSFLTRQPTQLITPDRPLSAVMRLIWLKIRFRFAWNLSNLRASDQSYFFRSNGHFPGLRPRPFFTIYYQFNDRIGSFGCSPRVIFSQFFHIFLRPNRSLNDHIGGWFPATVSQIGLFQQVMKRLKFYYHSSFELGGKVDFWKK